MCSSVVTLRVCLWYSLNSWGSNSSRNLTILYIHTAHVTLTSLTKSNRQVEDEDEWDTVRDKKQEKSV